jgi:hypothetical protein
LVVACARGDAVSGTSYCDLRKLQHRIVRRGKTTVSGKFPYCRIRQIASYDFTQTFDLLAASFMRLNGSAC